MLGIRCVSSAYVGFSLYGEEYEDSNYHYYTFSNNDGTETQTFYTEATCSDGSECDFMFSSFNYPNSQLFDSIYSQHFEKGHIPIYARLPDQVLKTGVTRKDSNQPLSFSNLTSEFTYYSYNSYVSYDDEGHNVSVWKAYDAKENKNSNFNEKTVLENRSFCGDRPKFMVMQCHSTSEVSIIDLGMVTVHYTANSTKYSKIYMDNNSFDYLDHKEASQNTTFTVTSVDALTISGEPPCTPVLTNKMVLGYSLPGQEIRIPDDPPGIMDYKEKRYFPGCTLDNKGTDDISDDIISTNSWPNWAI